MKIRIIKEKSIDPKAIPFPTRNKAIYGLQQPNTNLAAIPREPLQVFIHQHTWRSIWQHSVRDNSIEIGGALLGRYGIENGQRFLLITDVFHQPLEYSEDPTLLRFTRLFFDDLETYIDDINKQHPDILRLGLYHTHPGYGVFLSQTDEDTLRGVFNLPHQIAMVVDPVKQEDGIFFCSDKKISPRAGYILYDSKDPAYSPHKGQTNNPYVAQYNSLIQLNKDTAQLPRIEIQKRNQVSPPQNQSSTSLRSSASEREKSRLQQEEREQMSLANPEREKMRMGRNSNQKQSHKRIQPLNYFPKICPLVDGHYNKQLIRLDRYNRPMQSYKQLEEFPFMMFIHQQIIQQLPTEVPYMGLLKGRACYDQKQDMYFNFITDFLPSPPSLRRLAPLEQLARMTQYYSQQPLTGILGWLLVLPQRMSNTYPFFELHQQLFKKSHHMGVMIPQFRDSTELDMHQIQIAAFNYQKGIPYEFFDRFFLYEEV